MARTVGKVHFPVSDTFRLNGVKVVRVAWPIDQPVHDDTELRAYGPRGFIGMIRPGQEPKLHNTLYDFKYLRPGTAPRERTNIELWNEAYEKCFTPDGLTDRSEEHADALARAYENADATLETEGARHDDRGRWANHPAHPRHDRWCEIAYLTLEYISDTEGLEL
jgi:hypothetical protein